MDHEIAVVYCLLQCLSPNYSTVSKIIEHMHARTISLHNIHLPFLVQQKHIAKREKTQKHSPIPFKLGLLPSSLH